MTPDELLGQKLKNILKDRQDDLPRDLQQIDAIEDRGPPSKETPPATLTLNPGGGDAVVRRQATIE